jgi:hypothetical protein
MPSKTRVTKTTTWWRAEVASTSPPAGLFTRDAQTIARTMATRRVSPKGLGSASG